jgi:prepilin-type N-terminal cleavage/methylation domain-containing protein
MYFQYCGVFQMSTQNRKTETEINNEFGEAAWYFRRQGRRGSQMVPGATESSLHANMKRLLITSKSGFTLVEMSVVIAVILILAGAASLCIKPYLDYRDGQKATETLQTVKAARLMYLSDHPATDLANLTQADLLPYMPNGVWPNPELPLVNGVPPPTINFTGFTVTSSYQPPGSPINGLWDGR